VSAPDQGDDLGVPMLHRRFPELRDSLPHAVLSERPTPVRELGRLNRAAAGRAPLWIKDDGAYRSGGWGGNMVRKLEWLLPEAERRGAKTILTVGGLGTNWGLAAALYGRQRGLKTALALVDQPLDDHVRAQFGRLQRSGATIHRTHTKARTIAAAPGLYLRHFDGLTPPYLLPAGGSSPVGAIGYVEGALEIAGQVASGLIPEPAHVVTAAGSGGTAAGLAVGLRLAGLASTVVAVVVNDSLRLDRKTLTRLGERTEKLLRRRGATFREPKGAADLRIDSIDDWLGPGYGHPTAESQRALELAAESEGLTLDPVYTAKAMAATLALNAAGRFGDGPVLVLQTDGPRPGA
jgi:D-cysteine desulfhydrase